MSFRPLLNIARHSFLLVLVTLFSLPALRAADDEKQVSTPDILPDGTIMYAEIAPWENWSRDFAKTSLAKIFAEPEVRQFLAGPFSQISYLIRQTTGQKPVEAPRKPDEPAANAFSTVMDVASQFTPGPFAVAVRFSPEDAQAGRMPAVAVIAGMSQRKDFNNIMPMVDMLLQASKFDAVAVTDYQGVKLITVKRTLANGKELTSALTFHNGRMIVATDVTLCQQILDGMAGTLARKLSGSETFKNCGLAGNEHLIAFLDVAGLKSAFGAMEKPLPDAPNQIDDFFVLAGLNKSIAVAWSLRMNGPAFESRTAIFSKGEREGLLGTLDEEPLSAGAIKHVPQGAPFAVGFRLRSQRILPFVRQTVKALQGPKGLEHFDEVEKQLSAELGRELDKEVQGALGGEVVISSVAGAELVSPLSALSAATMSLSVKDAAKANELLGQLLTRYAKSAGGGAEVKEVEFDGAKIRYLPGRKMGGIVDISPAFVIADNHLLIALDVPTLKKSMNILKNGPSLADSDAFKTALTGVGGKIGPMFSYVDWAFAYRSVFSVGASALKLVAPTDVLKDIGVDLNLLPETSTISQHLFPGLSVAQITPTGIVLTSRSPLPSIEVLSPPLAAVSAVFNTFKPFLVAPEPPKAEKPPRVEKR
jgi:hypothetical protein